MQGYAADLVEAVGAKNTGLLLRNYPYWSERMAALSDKQQTVVDLIAIGLNNEGIARYIDMTATRTRQIVSEIYMRLGISRSSVISQRSQLISIYWRKRQQWPHSCVDVCNTYVIQYTHDYPNIRYAQDG